MAVTEEQIAQLSALLEGYEPLNENWISVILYVVVYLRCRIMSKEIGASKPVGQTDFRLLMCTTFVALAYAKEVYFLG
ncbi:MAG: hypothetical protein HFG37_06620 [Eubacterium sp.]|nr:hypothetical protein [Eubacterium sp.]